MEENEREEEAGAAPQISHPGDRFPKPPSKWKYDELLTQELEIAAIKKQNLLLEQEKLKLEIKLLNKNLDLNDHE